jgi:hypothetical protein
VALPMAFSAIQLLTLRFARLAGDGGDGVSSM